MRNIIKKYQLELLIAFLTIAMILTLIWCGVLVYREVFHVCKEYNVYEEALNREKDLEDRKINFAAIEKETPNVSAWLSSSLASPWVLVDGISLCNQRSVIK